MILSKKCIAEEVFENRLYEREFVIQMKKKVSSCILRS